MPAKIGFHLVKIGFPVVYSSFWQREPSPMPAKSSEEKSTTKRTQSNTGEELICDPLLPSVCFMGDDMGVISKWCVQMWVMRTVHTWRIIETMHWGKKATHFGHLMDDYYSYGAHRMQTLNAGVDQKHCIQTGT